MSEAPAGHPDHLAPLPSSDCRGTKPLGAPVKRTCRPDFSPSFTACWLQTRQTPQSLRALTLVGPASPTHSKGLLKESTPSKSDQGTLWSPWPAFGKIPTRSLQPDSPTAETSSQEFPSPDLSALLLPMTPFLPKLSLELSPVLYWGPPSLGSAENLLGLLQPGQLQFALIDPSSVTWPLSSSNPCGSMMINSPFHWVAGPEKTCAKCRTLVRALKKWLFSPFSSKKKKQSFKSGLRGMPWHEAYWESSLQSNSGILQNPALRQTQSLWGGNRIVNPKQCFLIVFYSSQ